MTVQGTTLRIEAGTEGNTRMQAGYREGLQRNHDTSSLADVASELEYPLALQDSGSNIGWLCSAS